ncbi:MAG: bifunctional serine/threonine-protein kinase/formylglycine-generating enzyme family protein, partial [Chthoniobacteraceae bacterium]
MIADTTCTTCGTPLPGKMLGGLCPACVRRVAMMEPSHSGDSVRESCGKNRISGGWEPLTTEEVAALLPAGAYTVESLVGRGGMGAVYKAWQKSLDRHVAIKILPPDLLGGDLDFAGRFKREARATAKLKHPGIVPVHDAGESAEGFLYFVMDFVEGTDVQKMIAARGKLPPEEALGIVARVLGALACAHEHGIIHRDIKPANIMVAPDGQVLVADFGLARSTATDTTLFTGSHVAMGTPDYMPPEAKRGLEPVDQRADLFAVGVMLYEMLTGQVPRGRFDPPSRVVPGLDRRLDSIVDKLLQTDRDKRYSTAIEVKTALDPILTRTLARRSGRTPSAAKTKRTSMLIATAVAVLAAGGWFAWKKHRTAAPRALALSTDPSARNATPGTTDAALATKDVPFINTLGMKFVPVPITGGPTNGQRVLFSVWETRVQDYDLFAKETQREWRSPDFEQGPMHPAILLTWDDANSFCTWLTERESNAGRLGSNERYRLPSDHEWSCAAGIGARENPVLSPSEKNEKLPDLFPWGGGNFAGEETHGNEMNKLVQQPPTTHRDDFIATAPVGSFPPDSLGLCD